MLANTRQSYGLVAQILHWLTAGFILFLLPLGVYMHELPTATPAEIDAKIWFYSLHKTIGILAFGTAVLRVLWALLQVSPTPLNAERKFETVLAGGIHWLLYASILLMPITGWLHHAALEGFAPIWWPWSQDLAFVPKDIGLAELLGVAHKFTAIMLMGSLALHIAGALKHALIDHDLTLSRMLPRKKVELSESPQHAHHKAHSRLIAGSALALLAIAIFASQLHLERPAENVSEIAGITDDSGWMVDHSKSSLNIEIIQNKNPVNGKFADWRADIIFDPDALDKAMVNVTVNTASLTVGGVTKDALSANFLNVDAFPEAVFSSNRFVQIADGKYEAQGELSLAGTTRALTLPFDLKIENGRAFMQSTIELQRLDYELGRKGYTTDGILGFGVKIEVMLEAEKT